MQHMQRKVLVSSMAMIILMCSNVVMAEQQKANFTATITADIPSDFSMLTKDDNQDNITLTFPESNFNPREGIFADQFKLVKIVGTGVGTNTSVDISADNLTLKSDDGNDAQMVVMFADDKGHVPAGEDIADDMLIADPATHVTLNNTKITTFSSFYVGYNLAGTDVAPGHYTGAIVLTATADL